MLTFCVRHLKRQLVHSQKIIDVSDVQVSDKDAYKPPQQYDHSKQQDRERANLKARFSFRQQDCLSAFGNRH